MLKKYFSNDAINKLFTLYNGEYYVKERVPDPLPGIFGLTDQGIRTLTVVNYTDTKISATGQLTDGQWENDKTPLKIEFLKEGNDWLINYFE